MSVYFAHAMTDYGTWREAAAMIALRRHFGDVVNPSDQIHCDAAAALKRAGHNAMDYFTALVRDSKAVAFMETIDTHLGPGVAKEVIEAYVFGIPVYRVVIVPGYGGYDGAIRGPFTSREFLNLNVKILTIAEIRERIALKAEG